MELENNEKVPGQEFLATCEHCPYWVKNNSLQDITNRTGECRANPPQMLATPVQTDQGMGLNIQSMFPITASKAWCSHHPVYQVEQRIQEAVEVTEALAEMAAEMVLGEAIKPVTHTSPEDLKPGEVEKGQKLNKKEPIKAPSKAGEKIPK